MDGAGFQSQGSALATSWRMCSCKPSRMGGTPSMGGAWRAERLKQVSLVALLHESGLKEGARKK